jgi:hypothetical protein
MADKTNTPAQSAIFSVDPFLAKQLGFVCVALSGSRAYQSPQGNLSTACDWDFVGVVEQKCDTLDLVRHRREELYALIGIVQPEHFPWEVRLLSRLFIRSLNADRRAH